MTTSIYELFPSLDRGVVADVLQQCSNNADQAIDMLLGMSLDTAALVGATFYIEEHVCKTRDVTWLSLCLMIEHALARAAPGFAG